ncbi:DNA glycosylase AlkZ-like family protein [Pseudarthrobacter sp. J1763]|uniref:DNA glycosylase AlkZ-like family protein n=1 Tax=Pseudarthrobacter sp. J1763 TaxID=3420445 RepID=UPI003D2821D0
MSSTSANATTDLNPAPPDPATLTPEFLRAWFWHKQGLDGSLAGASPEQVLATAGWARSVGGANPYLTLFARAGITREQTDQAVLNLDIHELPTARGCTYVLGKSDFRWALRLGADAALASMKVLERLGVERGEITLLEEQVLHTLNEEQQPLDPKQLRELLGESVRSLGEEGRKKGASTTLPTALGLLQADGRIRRVPINGRLDQQRYAYTAWQLTPNENSTAENSTEETKTELTDDGVRNLLMQRYLGWTGGATAKQSQWFTGFTVAQTKKALAAAGAEGVTTAAGEQLWMLPDDVVRLGAFTSAKTEQIQLLAGTDSLFLLRRNAADYLDPADKDKKVLDGTLALQADLPDHPILDRGRIIGLWQYDPGQEQIAYWLFVKETAAIKDRIKEVEAWIRDELGDFRSFSLDSAKSRQKRIDALNAAS